MQSPKHIVRAVAPNLYHILSRIKSSATVGLRSPSAVFGSVYTTNRWGSAVSRSGTGSDLLQTRVLRAALPELISDLKCRVLLDIPCGDYYWLAQTALALDQYIGADIVQRLIETNERTFGDDNHRFVQLDLTTSNLPKADVILCRDCLVHLSFDDIFRALDAISASGSTYLLTTTFVDRSKNHDILTGSWRPINLEGQPFNFPPPMRMINEHCTEGDGRFADKHLALWLVADLGRLKRHRLS